MIERICIILLLNILFYFKSLGLKYCSDDIPVYNNTPKDLNRWVRLYRQIEGSIRVNPLEDHAITMCIHALVSAFLYVGFGCSDISFIAAILFSLNPINNQGSIWISGRGYSLPTMFILMALSIPVLGPLFMIGASYYNAGFISILTLVGSKESWLALFIPIIWLYHGKRFGNNVSNKMNNEMFDEDKKVKPEKLILAIKTFGFYLSHAIIPFKTTFYHSFLQSAAGNYVMRARAYSLCRFFWIGCLAILSGVFYISTHKWDMVCFSILWWCICIAPFCNLFRLSQECAERYVYQANVGLMFILATVLYQYPILVAFFIGMYSTKTWFWMDAYMDDYFLTEFSCLVSPDSWFAWHIRAMKRWDAGSYKEALTLWVMAKIVSPKEFKVLLNIATVLKLGGNAKEADEYLKEAEANIPAGQENEAGEIIKKWKEGNLAVLL